jgi:hypothetical protein
VVSSRGRYFVLEDTILQYYVAASDYEGREPAKGVFHLTRDTTLEVNCFF